MVSAGSSNIISQKFIYGYVSGILAAVVSNTDANDGNGWSDTIATLYMIVPPGKTYYVSAPYSYTVKKYWIELR